MRKPRGALRAQRRGKRGGFGTKLRKCTESSQLIFDHIMLLSRTPNADHHSYSLLQARSVASCTTHTRPIGPLALSPVPLCSLAEPRLLTPGAPRRPRDYLKVTATRLSVPLYYSRSLVPRLSLLPRAIRPLTPPERKARRAMIGRDFLT